MSELFEWIKKEIDQTLIPALQGFVKIKNQSRAFDPEWETDELNLQACLYVADWSKSQNLKGCSVQVLQEKGRTPCVFVVIKPESFETSVLMYGHLDKQPPIANQWSQGLGPYDPVIKDGKLYGRGAADDGYSFFLSIIIFKALQKFNLLFSKAVLMFETDEESESKDIIYFIDKHADEIGEPNLIYCLDGGCIDYNHWCITMTLRGVLDFSLKVEVTNQAVHSGNASGIIPDTFRIARNLIDRFENPRSGKIELEDLHVNIPYDKYHQACELFKYMDNKIDWQFPFINGVLPTVDDAFQQYLNRAWTPQLTLVGIDGVPNVNDAGNVLRPWTKMNFSLRIPPTLPKDFASLSIKSFFDKLPVPYNAKATVELSDVSQGLNSRKLDPDVKKIIAKGAEQFFGTPPLFISDGISIPIVSDLEKRFAKAQFIVSGVLGPKSNPHGPDESLNIDYLKKLACAVAYLIQQYETAKIAASK